MARLLQLDVECVARFVLVRGNWSKCIFFRKHTDFYSCPFSETGQNTLLLPIICSPTDLSTASRLCSEGNKSKIPSSPHTYRRSQYCTLHVRFSLFDIRFLSPMITFQSSMFTFWYFWFLLFGLSGIVILIFPISSKGLIYFSEKFLLPASPINSCISFRLRGTEQNWIISCILTCSLSCSFEASSTDDPTIAVVASDREINSHKFLLFYFTCCISH